MGLNFVCPDRLWLPMFILLGQHNGAAALEWLILWYCIDIKGAEHRNIRQKEKQKKKQKKKQQNRLCLSFRPDRLPAWSQITLFICCLFTLTTQRQSLLHTGSVNVSASLWAVESIQHHPPFAAAGKFNQSELGTIKADSRVTKSRVCSLQTKTDKALNPWDRGVCLFER